MASTMANLQIPTYKLSFTDKCVKACGILPAVSAFFTWTGNMPAALACTGAYFLAVKANGSLEETQKLEGRLQGKVDDLGAKVQEIKKMKEAFAKLKEGFDKNNKTYASLNGAHKEALGTLGAKTTALEVEVDKLTNQNSLQKEQYETQHERQVTLIGTLGAKTTALEVEVDKLTQQNLLQKEQYEKQVKLYDLLVKLYNTSETAHKAHTAHIEALNCLQNEAAKNNTDHQKILTDFEAKIDPLAETLTKNADTMSKSITDLKGLLEQASNLKNLFKEILESDLEALHQKVTDLKNLPVYDFHGTNGK